MFRGLYISIQRLACATFLLVIQEKNLHTETCTNAAKTNAVWFSVIKPLFSFKFGLLSSSRCSSVNGSNTPDSMLDLSSKLLASQQQQPLFPPKSQVANRTF